MLVTVAPASPHSESKEPHAKPLTLIWRDWQTSSAYISGTADSHTRSISLHYGPRHGMCLPEPEAKAFIGSYSDPQMALSGFSHGGVRSVVEKVVRDMGVRECEFGNKLEVIDALLGDDGKKLLESHTHKKITLRKIIEDKLEEEDDNWDGKEVDSDEEDNDCIRKI
jgi:hypothetical protein